MFGYNRHFMKLGNWKYSYICFFAKKYTNVTINHLTGFRFGFANVQFKVLNPFKCAARLEQLLRTIRENSFKKCIYLK